MKKRTEVILRGAGFGIVFLFFVIGFGMLFRLDNKTIGFILISCGIYGIYINWLYANNFFVHKIKRGKK